MKSWTSWLLLVGVVALATLLAWQWGVRFFVGVEVSGPAVVRREAPAWLDRVGWLGSPGPLSAAHAGLSRACQACHVPFRRIPAIQCLGCHARNTGLLNRRDTAFHAAATECLACHSEHQGRTARISRMDHTILNPDVGCAVCHIDRHQTLFGGDCLACHEVMTWKLPGYRHPSPQSTLCAECHPPPPSHLMMHFQTVDQTITRQWHATVEQCWRCHTTDHWNNIIGVGLYKHH